MLMQGAFSSGESIPVRAVSESLGIGLTPVREALQRLAAEGVLEGSANRGVRAARLDRAELETLYETRMLLESEAASLAARRITAAELREVEETFRRVVRAADAGDAPACLAANMAFHFRIYSASRLPLLVRCIEQMWLRIGPVLMERARSRPLTARNFFGSSRAAHERLLKALQRHDGPAARDCVRQLLYVGYDMESAT
jgi:DNA-binding GntR family transcriptional regulator